MENATKALLIAAAILVAIIIISLGLAVVRQGQEAISNADMSEAEMESYNSKFKNYEGTNVSTADVNALLSTVLSHNQSEAKKGSGRAVVVKINSSEAVTTSSSSVSKLSGTNYYTVTCKMEDGLVTEVNVQKNS